MLNVTENFEEYKKSVYELANKLPQWNSDDYSRRYYSAVSSLFEEAGELSGLISKKRIRKNYWFTKPSNLIDFEEIKQKFIDEASDFLWVLVCSCYSLGYTDLDFIEQFDIASEEFSILSYNFEQSLFNVIADISSLNMVNNFQYKALGPYFNDIIYSFGVFIQYLNTDYGITLDDLIRHNNEKLSNRYDKDGKRVDDN